MIIISVQNSDLPKTSNNAPANNPERSRKVFLLLVLLAAVAGVFLIVSAVFAPHKTGIVTRVGRITTREVSSGVGRHRSTHERYASDVKVRVKDTSETETVYYRVKNIESIPQVGDEIQFGYSLAVGNVPYPQMWAVWVGVFLLGLAAVLFGGFKIDEYRKKRAAALLDNAENNSI